MVAMRHVGAVVLLSFLSSVVAAGQTAPRTKEGKAGRMTLVFAEKVVGDWTAAVRAHTAGTFDKPAETIASWPIERVTLALRLVSPARNAARVLMLGLVLHTDIAIAEGDSPVGTPGAVVLLDGHVIRHIGRSAHWPIARQIAADLAPRPGEAPRVTAWYRAIAAVMQQCRDLELLGQHLEAGQRLFLDDPVLALYQGTLRQTFGDARLQKYLRQRGSTEGLGRPPRASRERLIEDVRGVVFIPPPSQGRLPGASRVELGVARREFRRALTLDPALHEARVRLAHVLSRLGDHREAAEVVRPALEAALPPLLEFYAAVILGRSEEQLGRFDEAGVAYARAAARFPGAPSAEIGRSRVALAQGRPRDAEKMLVDVVGPDSTGQPDPWLDYLRLQDPDGETQLKAWHADLK
jgi:tetratricopeptide (TPR) repeat protein